MISVYVVTIVIILVLLELATFGWCCQTNSANFRAAGDQLLASAHAKIDPHIVDDAIHFTKAATRLSQLGTKNLQDLDNITSTNPQNDDVLTFRNGKWVNATGGGGGGTTDHTALSNIGTNSHAAIDTHIADITTHFTKASTDLSQLGTKNIEDLDNVTLSNPQNNEVLTFTGGTWVNAAGGGGGGGTTDHTALSNIGTNTHAAIDTHIADATVHFTEAAIVHQNISGAGTNTHAAIDTHIADATVHFTEAAIVHQNISGAGTNTHAAIDTHIADATVHFTEASIVHQNISGAGTNTHAAIDAHIADATVHFTEASIVHQNISGAGTNTHAAIDAHIADITTHFTKASTDLSQLGTKNIEDLDNVTLSNPQNNEVLTFTGGTWVNAAGGGGGTTDHTALSNIGTNTHAAIDTHIADADVHFTKASTNLSQLGTKVIQDLDNVSSAADPGNDARFLRWDDTANQWVDDRIRVEISPFNLIDLNIQHGEIVFPTNNTDRLLMKNADDYYMIPAKNVGTSTPVNYSDFNTNYTPLVRWEPTTLGGATGALTWPSIVGSGTIQAQGVAASYVDASVGGKRAYYSNPVSSADHTHTMTLDMGQEINVANGLTIAFVIQDLEATTSFGRFISLMNSGGAQSDFNNSANKALLLANLVNGFTTFYSGSERAWNPGGIAQPATIGVPTVFIARYMASGASWKMWINQETDVPVNSSVYTVSMNNFQRITFSDIPSQSNCAKMRVAEVAVWDTALSDGVITNISQTLLVEYGVRSTGAVLTTNFNQNDLGDTTVSMPAVSQLMRYNGTAWTNFTMPMGEMAMIENVTNTVISAAATPTKVLGTTVLQVHMSLFDMPVSNQLRYIGTTPVLGHCGVTFDCRATGGVDRQLMFYVQKNGVTIAGSSVYVNAHATRLNSTAIHIMAQLTTNDYLELWCENVDTSDDVLVKNINMFVMGI